MMKRALTVAAAACAGAMVAAHPSHKTCTQQVGSDALGLPTVDGTFTAMSSQGVTWDTKFTDGSSAFFEPYNGNLRLHIPATFNGGASSTYGFFAIVDFGNISFVSAALTNDCTCDRLVCFVLDNDYDFAVTVVNTDPATCAATRIVVGYGDGSSPNELQFATLNTCDSSTIGVSAAAAPPTTTTTTTTTTTATTTTTTTASVAATGATTSPNAELSDCAPVNQTYDTDSYSWQSDVPCLSDMDCACIFDNTDWTCGFFGTPFAVITEYMTQNTCFKSWVAYLFVTLACVVVVTVIALLICVCVKCARKKANASSASVGSPSSRAVTRANVYELTTPTRKSPTFGVPDTWGTNEVEVGASPMSQRYKQTVRASAERRTMGM